MNDDIREKLSAYLDGALPDAERRAVEVEIARSEEMRLELEALRAVSGAVKALPKENLPAGFMARLAARRAREDAKPAREYFILPPAYRPLAAALSMAVIALVVWDKTHTSPDIVAPRVGWDSEKVAVKSAAEAPPSVDVSGKLAAMDSRGKDLNDEPAGNAERGAANELTAQSAKKEEVAKADVPSTFGKHISAPGKPLELQESDASGSAGPSPAERGRGTSSTYGSVAGAGGAGLSSLAAPSAQAPAAAAPAPARDQFEAAEGKSGAFVARNEEERSAINERLYKGFEEEKKRMGIARIMDKDAEPQNLPSGGREMMALQATPEAADVDSGRSVASVRGAKAKRTSAPIVKALSLKSADALQAAWAGAGLPGEPPAVDFSRQMAVFLAGPQGCGIVSIQNRKKFIVVLYKDAGFDDASQRARAVELSPKPVVVKRAE